MFLGAVAQSLAFTMLVEFHVYANAGNGPDHAVGHTTRHVSSENRFPFIKMARMHWWPGTPEQLSKWRLPTVTRSLSRRRGSQSVSSTPSGLASGRTLHVSSSPM